MKKYIKLFEEFNNRIEITEHTVDSEYILLAVNENNRVYFLVDDPNFGPLVREYELSKNETINNTNIVIETTDGYYYLRYIDVADYITSPTVYFSMVPLPLMNYILHCIRLYNDGGDYELGDDIHVILTYLFEDDLKVKVLEQLINREYDFRQIQEGIMKDITENEDFIPSEELIEYAIKNDIDLGISDDVKDIANAAMKGNHKLR